MFLAARDAFARIARRLPPARAALYLREAAKLRWSRPQDFQLSALLTQFRSWDRSQRSDANPLNDERPWITFEATDLLDSILTPAMSVFEFGSGGSTLFYARRVKQVSSVEHDRSWHRVVNETLTERAVANAAVRLCEPVPDARAARLDPADPDEYASSDEQLRGCLFVDYARAIDVFANESLDLVSVDGRARPACVRHAIPKIKPGGYLVLDNSDRGTYARSRQLIDALGWTRRDIFGPGPYAVGFWETSLWRRPSD